MEELFKLLEQLAERNQAESQFTPDNVEAIVKDPASSLRLAVASAAGAQNRISLWEGQPSGAQVADAKLCQAQADLWLSIHERQIELEDRARAIAEMGKADATLRGSRISEAFTQSNINRPGFSEGTRRGGPKVPPVPQQGPVPVIPFVGPDASSGSEDKPVT